MQALKQVSFFCFPFMDANAPRQPQATTETRMQLLLAQSGRRREVSTRCVEIAQKRARGKPEGFREAVVCYFE